MKNQYFSQLTVLYVEDEEDAREEIQEYLKLRVKKLYTAENGEQGLELFKKFQPDLVVTDIQMPKMNGLDMARQIKVIDNTTPIVVTTAFSDSKYMMESIDVGIDSYVLKPVKLKSLDAKLNVIAKTLVESLAVKKYEKLLKEYGKAVDAGAIVSKTDKSGIITYVNDEFCKISGYTREELIGKDHNLIRHPDQASETYEDLWATITKKETWKGKIKNLAKDGSEYYVTAIIVPILDENEEIVEYLALRQNVTELEELNNFLERRVNIVTQQNREKDKKHIETLTSFLENSPNPIIIYDDKKVQYANSKFLNLLPKDKKEIVGDEFELDSIFEDKPGTIPSLDKIDPKSETNKVSISKNIGRNIFYLLADDVQSIDNTPLTMYTFNNITLIEYQQLKISYYSARLEDFIKKINRAQYKNTKVDEKETIEQELEIEKEKVESITNDVIKVPEELSQEKRVLDSKEKNVLKKSRDNLALSADDYSNEIDEYILEEIQELIDIETEVNELLTEFEEKKKVAPLRDIATKIMKYASTVALLIEFEDLSFAIKSLGDLLWALEDKDVDDTNYRKIELFLSNILLDLSNWRRTIFVDRTANDVHYLDASLFSTILQFELIFNEADAIDDEDDFELF